FLFCFYCLFGNRLAKRLDCKEDIAVPRRIALRQRLRRRFRSLFNSTSWREVFVRIALCTRFGKLTSFTHAFDGINTPLVCSAPPRPIIPASNRSTRLVHVARAPW